MMSGLLGRRSGRLISSSEIAAPVVSGSKRRSSAERWPGYFRFTLPGLPDPPVEIEAREDRAVIRTPGEKKRGVALLIQARLWPA